MHPAITIKIPYGPTAAFVTRRHLDVQLGAEDSEVLARVEAALVASGATVRSYRGEEPVSGASASLRWILQTIRSSHLERIGLAEPGPAVEQQ